MKHFLLIMLFAAATVTGAMAQEKEYPKPPNMVPAMTEFWTPQPRIVTPADMDRLTGAPSDAIILFDGTNTSEWMQRGRDTIAWTLVDGALVVGRSDIRTKREFTDFQLHIEWSAPTEVNGESQGRGNSGVYLQGLYELQVLDSYDNETYVNGQAGSIYKQTAPLVNAMQKPGKWNVYDVIYTAPRFKENGTLDYPARVTVLHNGVVVQNNTTITGATVYTGIPKYTAHGPGPILLQNHSNPVRYRNIWIREL